MEDQSLQKKKEFLIKFAYWGIWLFLGGLLLKYAGPVLVPFLIACLVALILAKPIDRIDNILPVRRTFISVIIVLLFYALLCLLLLVVGGRIVIWIREGFAGAAVFFADSIVPLTEDFMVWAEGSLGSLDPAVASAIRDGTEGFLQGTGQILKDISSWAISGVSSFATKVPGFLMSVLIMIIASVFITIDYHKMIRFLKNQIPPGKKQILKLLRQSVQETLQKYAVSYVMILGITFLELCLGLLVLGVKNAVAFAFIISVLDILPVLGTGTVLIPWIVIEAIQKDYKMAIGLLALYILITVIRNITEPKLIGRQMGLSPIVTLLCVFLGLKFCGIIGLIGFPIIVSILKSLNDKGVIHIIKNDPDNSRSMESGVS